VLNYLCGASMSACGAFRYRLWRQWDEGKPRVLFVMLNPSTADGTLDDPTIRKCLGFAKRLGYGGIEVVNLFAFRATDPGDLSAAGWPVGPDNDTHIRTACGSVGGVICAWGSNVDRSPAAKDRAAAVRSLLHEVWGRCEALAHTKSGQPSHPLMLSYDRAPEWL
jgi:hypothetical protein